jgi:hypothetical protein
MVTDLRYFNYDDRYYERMLPNLWGTMFHPSYLQSRQTSLLSIQDYSWENLNCLDIW